MKSAAELLSEYLFWLAVLYFAVGLVVCAQLSRILYYKHNLYSFQFTFLVLCLSWSLMRGFYYIFVDDLANDIMLRSVMQWLPVNVEFATISMLVVFYASLAHKSTWRTRHRTLVLFAYGATNLLFLFAVCAQWVYFLTTRRGSFYTPSPAWLAIAQRVFLLVVYLVLAITLHAYMMKVLRVASEPSIKVSLQSSLLSPSQLLITNSIIVILFLTRCSYLAVTLLLDVGDATSNMAAGGDANSPRGHLITLITQCVWELIPTSLIIASFWRIPATGRARFKPNLAATADEADRFSYQTLPDPAYSVFSNPLRYDSDDDLLDERAPLVGDGGARAILEHTVGSTSSNRLSRPSSYAGPASYGSVSSLLGEQPAYGSINAGGEVRSAYSPYSTTPFGRTPPVHKPVEVALPSGAARSARKKKKSGQSSRSTRM